MKHKIFIAIIYASLVGGGAMGPFWQFNAKLQVNF